MSNVYDYRIKNWMDSHPQVVTKAHKVGEVVQMMASSQCQELPVVDEQCLIGVIRMSDCLTDTGIRLGWEEPIAPIISDFYQAVNGNFSVADLDVCPVYIVCDKTAALQGVVTQKELLKINHALSQQLRAAEEKVEWYKLCFDTAYEGIAIVDKSGVIQLFNETYSRYVGVSKEEAIGLPVENVIENTRIPIVLQTGVPERNQIHRLQGQRMIVHRMPIWKDGHIIGAVGMLIYEGVTEIQQIISQLEVQNKKQSPETTLQLSQRSAHESLEFEDILGESLAISQTKKLARRAAHAKATVLITGESGVGKEQFARAIHDAGITRSGRFVTVNCAAIPENLLESELFGYTEGAFTGAQKGGKQGKFELAHNGTIFLDEIGDMPMATQVKILRVIQEKEVERIGGTNPIQVDFRLIAATNQDLKELVRKGKFREDLFYRLHVIPLHIPPLRERKNDIPLIVSAQLPKLCQIYGVKDKIIEKEVMQLFFRYHWPGNVRELLNVLERLFALTSGPRIRATDLPTEFTHMEKKQEYLAVSSTSLRKRREARQFAEVEEEKELIERVLKEAGGNKSEAAKHLGISRATLYNKLSRYQEKNCLCD